MRTDIPQNSKTPSDADPNAKPAKKANRRLVKEAMRGNPEAIGKVIGLYYKDIFYFATKKVGAQDAEDVSQQAISEIINDFGKLRDPAKIRSWMMRVVRNSCLDYMRKDKLTNKLFTPIENDEQLLHEPQEESYEFLPEAALANAETRNQVLSCIDTLPENYAEVMRLYYLEELDYDEIAEVLQIPRRKVKNDLYNARILFKKNFENNTGIKMRLALTPLASVPILTEILKEECNQLATPALLERLNSFTNSAMQSKLGATASSTLGSFGAQGSPLATKILVSCLAFAAVAGIGIAFVAGNQAQPAPAPASTSEAPAAPAAGESEATTPEAPIETLSDMIGAQNAALLENYAQQGTNKASAQAFLTSIGADHYNSSYEQQYYYALYVLEKQDKQLILATRSIAHEETLNIRYEFRPTQEPPRMLKVALMFT